MTTNQKNTESNGEYKEIDFDDFEVSKTSINKKNNQIIPENPIVFLPADLQENARKLPRGKEHTVLQCANEGDGHNNSLLTISCIMFKMGVSFDDAYIHLKEVYNPARIDYETAPLRALNKAWQFEGDQAKITDTDFISQPKKNDAMLLRFRRMTQQELILASPSERDVEPISIIENLFAADDIINIQQTAYEAGTLIEVSQINETLNELATSISKYKFLNPSTFKKVQGVPNTKNNGKISTRCNDNVKKRDYMVLEMDDEDFSQTERFNGFAYAMAQYACLKMAVDTGGKSVHFWFDATNVKPKVRNAFFALACLHGADPRLAVKSQIARMPNVSSAKDGRGSQSVIYFDAENENYPDNNSWDIKGFDDFLLKSKQLECYYKPGGAGAYYTKDDRNKWRGLDKGSFKIHLNALGFRSEKMEGESVAPADMVVMDIQNTKTIEAVFTNMSGRHAGFYEEDGSRFLVTNSPVFLKPRKGEFKTIKRFLRGMLIDKKQFNIFIGWVSAAIKDLRNDGQRVAKFTQLQMLHVCGPPNSGKTLLLEYILKFLFGGRIAKCDSYFRQQSNQFNAELFGAELLFNDDSPVFSSNYRYRQEMSEKMKSITVGGTGRLEKKGVDAITVRPWWRVIRFLNNDVQHLATLPLQEDGVDDKWILLETQALNEHWPESELPGWANSVMKAFSNELPAFLHYLIEEHETHDDDKDKKGRYGIETYKNQTLLEAIAEGSPEQYLLYRFDNDCKLALFGNEWDDSQPLTKWRGSSNSLYELLATTGSRIQQQRFQKICPNNKILQAQLRQIEKDGNRIVYSLRCDDIPNKHKSCEYWQIQPPLEVDKESSDNNKIKQNDEMYDFM